MNNLSAFLSQNAIKVENIEYIASKRFLDEQGKAIAWELKNITSLEDEAIRKSCIKKVQVPGKRGQFTQEFDANAYISKLVASCVVYPNLRDVELQNSYGVMGEVELLNHMLIPGELNNLAAKVQEINGLNETMDDLVTEAKN
jgi:hypothetical protein